MLLAIALGVLVFVSAAAGDVVEIYTTRAMTAATPSPHRVARLSILMWGIGAVGWVIVVGSSLWYLVPEVLGLYAGSFYGASRIRRTDAATNAGAVPESRPETCTREIVCQSHPVANDVPTRHRLTQGTAAARRRHHRRRCASDAVGGVPVSQFRRLDPS